MLAPASIDDDFEGMLRVWPTVRCASLVIEPRVPLLPLFPSRVSPLVNLPSKYLAFSASVMLNGPSHLTPISAVTGLLVFWLSLAIPSVS